MALPIGENRIGLIYPDQAKSLCTRAYSDLCTALIRFTTHNRKCIGNSRQHVNIETSSHTGSAGFSAPLDRV